MKGTLPYLHWKLVTALDCAHRDHGVIEHRVNEIMQCPDLEEIVRAQAARNRKIGVIAHYDADHIPGVIRKIEIRRNGKTRTVWSPSNEDYVQQQYLLHGIVSPIVEANISEQSHAFRAGHSTDTAVVQVMAAVSRFAGQNVILRQEDVKDCFNMVPLRTATKYLPSSTAEAIERIQRRYKEANHTTGGWTPGLPQGAPIAPAVANLIIEALLEPTRKRWGSRAVIVVYADDITMVGPRESVRQIRLEIIETLKSHGMELNPEKARSITPRPGQWLQLLGLEIEWERADKKPTIRPRARAYENLSDKIAEATTLKDAAAIARGWKVAYARCNNPQHAGRTKQATKEGIIRMFNRPATDTTRPLS